MAQGFALGQPYSDGLSSQRVLTLDTPAAGASFSKTLDARYLHRLVSLVFTFSTDSNAANRYVTVEYQGGDGIAYAVEAAAVVVTASTTNQRFVGSFSRGVAEWNTGTDVLFPLPRIFLQPGDTFNIHVANVQVGDTLTNIRAVFDRFPTGSAPEPYESD